MSALPLIGVDIVTKMVPKSKMKRITTFNRVCSVRAVRATLLNKSVSITIKKNTTTAATAEIKAIGNTFPHMYTHTGSPKSEMPSQIGMMETRIAANKPKKRNA